MKAMIFAAGLGTRLRPLTDHLPKALVPVDGVPMLERVILRLKEAGFTEIVINIHHFGEQILEFVRSRNDFGVKVYFSDERGELLDTGGGIRKARPFLDGKEPFLVHNADILTDLDLRAMMEYHLVRGADATLLVGRRQSSRYLLLDAGMRLHGWVNKKTGETKPEGLTAHRDHLAEYAFGGVHIISPSLFELMDAPCWEGKFSIIPFYLSVCEQVRLEGYLPQAIRWFDIGKPDTLELANQALRSQDLR